MYSYSLPTDLVPGVGVDRLHAKAMYDLVQELEQTTPPGWAFDQFDDPKTQPPHFQYPWRTSRIHVYQPPKSAPQRLVVIEVSVTSDPTKEKILYYLFDRPEITTSSAKEIVNLMLHQIGYPSTLPTTQPEPSELEDLREKIAILKWISGASLTEDPPVDYRWRVWVVLHGGLNCAREEWEALLNQRVNFKEVEGWKRFLRYVAPPGTDLQADGLL